MEEFPHHVQTVSRVTSSLQCLPETGVCLLRTNGVVRPLPLSELDLIRCWFPYNGSSFWEFM